jgi:hypothetical protein
MNEIIAMNQTLWVETLELYSVHLSWRYSSLHPLKYHMNSYDRL